MKAKQIKYIKFWSEKNAIFGKSISNKKISRYFGNQYISGEIKSKSFKVIHNWYNIFLLLYNDTE